MTPGEADPMNGGDRNAGRADEDLDFFLYLCRFIHEGYYNIRITWGEVRNLFSFAVKGNPHDVCTRMKTDGYTESVEDSDPFMILRRIDVHLSRESEERIISGFFDRMRKVPLAHNVAMISYLQKSLIMGIIGSFYDHELDFASTPDERVLISAVTSDYFISNEIVSGYLEKDISDDEYGNPDMEKYLENPWFNELILIIKNGYYGNGGFNYIDTLESSFRVEFTTGILEIIRNGGLLWLILNFREFIKGEPADRTIKKFVKKRRDEGKINRLYDWMSIGNDFAVGIEFLVGSVEFFPSYNPTVGIYLFIIGSTQLLIRPVISTSRKIHLHKLKKRRIKF